MLALKDILILDASWGSFFQVTTLGYFIPTKSGLNRGVSQPLKSNTSCNKGNEMMYKKLKKRIVLN